MNTFDRQKFTPRRTFLTDLIAGAIVVSGLKMGWRLFRRMNQDEGSQIHEQMPPSKKFYPTIHTLAVPRSKDSVK